MALDKTLVVMYRFVCVAAAIALAACQPMSTRPSVSPTSAPTPSGGGSSPSVSTSVPRDRPEPPTAALDSLIREAHMALDRDDCNTAIAVSEHGLRIERRSAPLYLVLAECYKRSNNIGQAREFTALALRYCHPDCARAERMSARLNPG